MRKSRVYKYGRKMYSTVEVNFIKKQIQERVHRLTTLNHLNNLKLRSKQANARLYEAVLEGSVSTITKKEFMYRYDVNSDIFDSLTIKKDNTVTSSVNISHFSVKNNEAKLVLTGDVVEIVNLFVKIHQNTI